MGHYGEQFLVLYLSAMFPSYIQKGRYQNQSQGAFYQLQYKLKADQSPPRNYPHTPTDYRHTDEHLKTGNDSYCSLLHLAKPRSNGSDGRAWTNTQTDRRTDGSYQVYYLHASRSIKIHIMAYLFFFPISQFQRKDVSRDDISDIWLLALCKSIYHFSTLLLL